MRGRCGGHRHRTKRDQKRRSNGIERTEKDDRDGEDDLREDQPPPSAAERTGKERRVERVDHRCPDEFDCVGQADKREESDCPEIDSAFGHPDRERRAGKGERQAGRKAEQQDDEHARPQIDGESISEGLIPLLLLGDIGHMDLLDLPCGEAVERGGVE